MSPSYSIIIPTAFDKCEALLKPCLESISRFTNLTQSEVIVVSNGCTDDTDAYVKSLGEPFRLVSYPDAIGYPQAINEGIRHSLGEFVVLLNNDTILLDQYRNCWIDTLHAPFVDPGVMITGPWMNWCPYAEHDFLIFFCVMIRKTLFDHLGMYLDAGTFGVGYGEDCDLCCKARQIGFKVVQVPVQDKVPYDGRMAMGQFPIYHAGNETFRNWPGGEELLRKNRATLNARYGTNIAKAHDLDGWVSDEELRWLAAAARRSETVIEIGSWHGKSSRAIADNLPVGGKLYCIDTWGGSEAEKDSNHASARMLDGDHAFDEFSRGLWDHIASGRVVPLRMHGRHGAKLLQDIGVKADLVFIDGGHGRGETKADIESFLPLRKEGGTICGHDYKITLWPDVTLEVLDIFGTNIGHPDDTSIWYTNSPPINRAMERPIIYDCFIFNNEMDILERRLSTLFDTVDRFVLVEATKTHSGNPKELVFHNNLKRFQMYLPKITYIVVEDTPEIEGTITDKSWARERHQRDAIMRGLTQCKDNDIIIISDCDEIPSTTAIQSYNGTNEIRAFHMELYYYNYETKAKDPWLDAKILPYGLLKQHSPCWARYEKAEPIADGGQHLSYFGGEEAIIRKIENTAHVEYDNDYYKNPERIKKAVEEHRDLFDRDYVKFQ